MTRAVPSVKTGRVLQNERKITTHINSDIDMYFCKILLVPGLFACLVTARAAEKDNGEDHPTTTSGCVEKKLISDVPMDVCQPSPCGPNSRCREINKQAICSCLPKYMGTPLGCRPEPECTTSAECSKDKACINQKCQDPCTESSCGINTDCRSNHHSPICQCKSQYTGNPFTRCYPIPPPVANSELEPYRNPCLPSPCGTNAICQVIGNVSSCACMPTYIGSPPNCRPECTNNYECSTSHACIQQKCRDPCLGSCGINSLCLVIQHTPICTCPEGFTGDPFTSCTPAAHCFWNDVEGAMSAKNFGVGAGKRYRPWDVPQDHYAQTSNVSAIHLPVRYRDAATSYQEDIAVLLLTNEFIISLAVRPACVDFDEDFDNQQLREGNPGTVLGWGLTKEDGDPSPILNYLELPVVSIEDCVHNADEGFLRYITSDKVCAGVTTGKALCRGDSGGGLVFTEGVGSLSVPYLRGVASTAPRNEHRCNAYALAALTHVRAHKAFLLRYIPNLEAECQRHYPLVNDIKNRYSSNDPGTCQPVQVTCNCVCNNNTNT